MPKNLEFAGRYAIVDPDVDVDNERQQEFSGVMTYFANGHANKVNFHASHSISDFSYSGIYRFSLCPFAA